MKIDEDLATKLKIIFTFEEEIEKINAQKKELQKKIKNMRADLKQLVYI